MHTIKPPYFTLNGNNAVAIRIVPQFTHAADTQEVRQHYLVPRMNIAKTEKGDYVAFFCFGEPICQAVKDDPQPQVEVAFGFLITN